jgi:hypothetical protein
VVAALSLVAAACSSAPPVGLVGTTLPAMNGTVKLVSVVSPAPVGVTSPGKPKAGHKLVAVILTVDNPSSSSVKFSSIYGDSRLIDSHKLTHVGASTAHFHVTQCEFYAPFSSVAANKSVTGCEVFQIAATYTPVKLKIGGKAKAEWNIAAASIVAGKAALYPIKKKTPRVIKPLVSLPALLPKGPASTAASTPAKTPTKTTSRAPAPGTVVTKRNRTFHLPTVTHINPDTAPPGQSVTIFGRRLSGAKSVTFGGVPGTITAARKHLIVVTVPASGVTGAVVISTPFGSARSPKPFVVE